MPPSNTINLENKLIMTYFEAAVAMRIWSVYFISQFFEGNHPTIYELRYRPISPRRGITPPNIFRPTGKLSQNLIHSRDTLESKFMYDLFHLTMFSLLLFSGMYKK